MQTSLDLIKQDIYDKVSDIDDDNVLNAIKTLIENLQKKLDDNITQTRDVNGYIKEWVKSM